MSEATNQITSDRTFLAGWVVLAIVGFLTVAGAWFGAQVFGKQLAHKHTQKQAELWKQQLNSTLKQGLDTYSTQQLSDDDKRLMHQLVASSDVFRVVLYNKIGVAFWSTHAGSIGKVAEPVLFTKVAAGKQSEQMGSVVAKEMDSAHQLTFADNLDPNSTRSTASIISPIYQGNNFVGGLGVHLDTTDLIAWNSANIKQATFILCGMFLALCLAGAALMIAYMRQRKALLDSASKARDEAVATELEAREMATELQKVNEDVIGLNKELKNNVKQLRDAQDEIIRKGKMAQLGQLTATVAHDLRNPLGAVRTAAYLISRKTEGKGLAIEKPLERINNGIERCNTIITELLDFSRSGALTLNSLDFDAWLRGLLEEQAPNLPEAVALEVHQGLGGLSVPFDPSLMQRCLVNLLSNASEAMVGKGDDPSVFTTRDPKIIVSTRQTGRGIELQVADNGPGMDEETIGKVLEPLFTTKSFGVGLGLPAIEKILEQHDGGLEIKSKVGQGTTMIAWFPAVQTVKEAA